MTCRRRTSWGGWPSAATVSRRQPRWPSGRADRLWGAFDHGGRLVGKAMDREQGHWFGGRLVPASGVASVAVTPEHRGSGVGRRLLSTLLTAARERGAAVSTLFPTTALPYRRVGWEIVGTLTWTAVPTAALAGRWVAGSAGLRPAEAGDVPAVLETYGEVARAGNGLMERSGFLFDTSPEAVLAGHDGITVAVGPDGDIEGYASWNRGAGYDESGRITVPDLIGLTARERRRCSACWEPGRAWPRPSYCGCPNQTPLSC